VVPVSEDPEDFMDKLHAKDLAKRSYADVRQHKLRVRVEQVAFDGETVPPPEVVEWSLGLPFYVRHHDSSGANDKETIYRITPLEANP